MSIYICMQTLISIHRMIYGSMFIKMLTMSSFLGITFFFVLICIF